MKTKDFITLGRISETTLEVEKLPKPYSVGKVKTPSSLNDLNMGDLMMLQSISSEHDFIFMPSKVLLNLDERKVLKAEASEVLGFSVWVAKEVQRINKLFASTSVPPTRTEQRAGANSLNFGPFGIVDYYALRMGIHNHKDVEDVPWVVVYKCLDMDAKKLRFDRKLRTLMSKR